MIEEIRLIYDDIPKNYIALLIKGQREALFQINTKMCVATTNVIGGYIDMGLSLDRGKLYVNVQ